LFVFIGLLGYWYLLGYYRMIVKIPHPALTSVAKPIALIDKKVLSVIEQLKKDLVGSKNPKGVGLAAPQIGIPLRIFITRPLEKSKIEVYINPQIIWQSETLVEIKRPERSEGEKPSLRRDKKLEGCLSIPNIWGYLKRADSVRLTYMDIEGAIQSQEFSGFIATIIQHETDHVNGILFTKRVLEQGGKLYTITIDKKGEETLVEIEI